MGDFNINLLHAESSNYAQEFLLSLQRFPFIPGIDKPTLVHNSSATLRGCLSKNRPLNFAWKIILPETLASERLYRDYN